MRVSALCATRARRGRAEAELDHGEVELAALRELALLVGPGPGVGLGRASRSITNCSTKRDDEAAVGVGDQLVGGERSGPRSARPRSPRRAARAVSRRGSDGSARCSSQAASTRRIRASSAVRSEIVAQSTSQITTRPPGVAPAGSRRRAAGMSSTYSSTWTLSAASKSAVGDRAGRSRRPRAARRCRCPSQRRAGHRRASARCESTPTTEPSAPTSSSSSAT